MRTPCARLNTANGSTCRRRARAWWCMTCIERTACKREERMAMSDRKNPASIDDRVHDEIVDSLDEERELEIDDERLAALIDQATATSEHDHVDRSVYFKELLNLQKELVKLQDWVIHQKLKVVVIFEGRDAA